MGELCDVALQLGALRLFQQMLPQLSAVGAQPAAHQIDFALGGRDLVADQPVEQLATVVGLTADLVNLPL
ncbi:hypothetical protein SAMN04489832_7216 [Micromonospora cremea]|uniref:Uncharacterized protein n=1 Tax=Micromonospora cremea TaxID=709881 RepID=A0A1N6BDI2_9ACTN|nr:hypothetical protein SAMN04489832_7216 [Micromonospora cremea]